MLSFFNTKRALVYAAVTAVVILSIAVSMILQAATGSTEPKHDGCYHVVDVSGTDWWFKTIPQFDVNTRAIKFETGYSAGWVWPASIEANFRCLDVGNP